MLEVETWLVLFACAGAPWGKQCQTSRVACEVVPDGLLKAYGKRLALNIAQTGIVVSRSICLIIVAKAKINGLAPNTKCQVLRQRF